ncbi:MAG: glutamate-5-semialdehyde dehydrogenase [Armatimonadetes bacterium]|nr:glutamate-5-semialdehyde dehydrogenase [Armatimonadota bacterium]
MSEVEQLARDGAAAAQKLATVSSDVKNSALETMASALEASADAIMAANAEDVARGEENGLNTILIDRLTLNPKRMKGMVDGLRQLIRLPDPIGTVLDGWRRPNGLEIARIRVPLGLIGIIYESRPNVTVDAAGLCLKSGNAVILRGGSEAIRSNIILSQTLSRAAAQSGIPPAAIQLIETTDRAAALELMRSDRYVSALIPRGGQSLIQSILDNATVPVIIDGAGNCHTYIDRDADLTMAADIAYNAKVSRPSVCNAMETLLVHAEIAPRFLPLMAARYGEAGVELRGCDRTRQIIPNAVPASEEDWDTEYLDLKLAIRVVEDMDQAIAHIRKHGTGHSEAIVTDDYQAAERFTQEVDAACVYVNASTRFTDGFEFGFGAEIGISNQKLHARGPMGLNELTTYKYVIRGNGQVRQ